MTARIYLDVLVPLPLSQPVYTYIAEREGTDEERLIGKLVVVPLGNKKSYTGMVLGVYKEPPNPDVVRYKWISKLLPYPPIPEAIIKLWKWASEYYMCNLGDLFAAAVPAGIRPDGYQDEELQEHTKMLKGWLPSDRFLEDGAFQTGIYLKHSGSPAVSRALDKIAAEYHPGTLLPMTLKGVSEWLSVSVSVVNKLREADVIQEVEVPAPETNVILPIHKPQPEDSLSQSIRFGSNKILLLHAPNSNITDRVPWSYLRQELIKERQILLIFPDLESLQIALPRLREQFGELLKGYYSTLSVKKRDKTWIDALEGESGLYVGLRAAVWLPYSALHTIVVVDEEDRGYRQYEPAPRFTATNVALMLAHFTHVPTILTSSTPSIESFSQALQKRYSYVLHKQEPRSVRLSSVWMPRAFEENRVQGRMLSFEMIGAIREAIDEQGIALLLYQRKGFARRAKCPHCEETPKCPVCHTIYRYFEHSQQLVCGMCGHHEPLPKLCPSCGKPGLLLEGTGIERLKSSIERLFPGVGVSIDKDRVDGKSQIILSSSYDPPIHLLQQATTIGIVQLDLLTTISDFRANEQAYRFMTKCRDEAPRLERMVIQHFVEEQNALAAFLENDYQIMLDHELEERHIVLFPPFSRHIDIYYESVAQAEAYKMAQRATEILRQNLSDTTVLGPAPLPVHKRDVAIGYKLTLLTPLTYNLHEVRKALHAVNDSLLQQYRGPLMRIYYDVDPL